MSARAYTRRSRVQELARLDPTCTADLFALRNAMVADADAEVRRSAIAGLDETGARQLSSYLRDAVHDPSMTVRESAFLGLGRARDSTALSLAHRAIRLDRSFRVRRAAVLFAVRACGGDAMPLLAEACRDPFWRVRVTARRAAAAFDPMIDVRSVAHETSGGASLAEIDDPDPAVVTARLGRIQSRVDPRALVPYLGQAHQALRRIALKEIAARGDLETLRAVLDWLRDERVPYGPAAAEATLVRSGARASALATQILHGEGAPPHVVAWALESVDVAPPWVRSNALLHHADARVRGAFARRVPEVAPDHRTLVDAMTSLLGRGDDHTKIWVATWLARSRSRDALAVLAAAPAQHPSPVRALAVRALFELGSVDGLRELAEDPHGGVRAAALEALSLLGALTDEDRKRLGDDPDPWVRDALRSGEAATRRPPMRAAPSFATDATMDLLRLARDPDLGVRSIAVDALAPHRDRVRELLTVGALGVSERIAAHTLLRLSGSTVNALETDPAVLAHLALLDDVVAGRAPSPTITGPLSNPAMRDLTCLRVLGKTALAVRPFGLSGAHGLSFDDFAQANDRGVNLFFWEPSHRELTRFLRARAPRDAVVVAGTYHADAASIERDVVRTLRTLRRDAVDVFLAFWTRSSARLDEVVGPLRALVDRGLVRAAGVSTHDRTLACEAADRGLDVVMVRHSAAHRGAEGAVFPHCEARGTGVCVFRRDLSTHSGGT
jgi:HEAT repeat protein